MQHLQLTTVDLDDKGDISVPTTYEVALADGSLVDCGRPTDRAVAAGSNIGWATVFATAQIGIAEATYWVLGACRKTAHAEERRN